MGVTDEELMVRFAQGDSSAFAQLFEKHKPRVMEFAEYIVRSREAAEDVAQETFLRVLSARASYRPTAKFTTWLYTIAKRLCFDELRKHRRQTSLESVLGHPPTAEDRLGFADPTRRPSPPRPDREVERREIGDLIGEAILTLSDEHQQVIRLRIDEGLGYAEAAERLGCSTGTAKSRMHYAMKNLREELLRRL